MKIRVRWVYASVFVALILIINTFAGFAGYFSYWLSIVLPLYAVFAILYLLFSWYFYAWFQEYSTNHPRKGETIHFNIRFSNDGFFPLCGGTFCFAMPDSKKDFALPVGFLPASPKSKTYQVDVACPYRGTYIAGIESINLSTPLGIIQTAIKINPQTFYVLPELFKISAFSESYIVASGSNISGGNTGEKDLSAFETIAPLLENQTGGRIAWKKWATTGIPSVIKNGFSRSQSVTVVLDLFPCTKVPNVERLAAEDLVISAAFSLLKYFCDCKIPTTFKTSNLQQGIEIDGEDAFKSLYERSVNIMFTDSSFPSMAFSEQSSVFLFTLRPLEELYADYEKSLHTGTEPSIFVCPPESMFNTEKVHANVIEEERHNLSSKSFFYIADVTNGTNGVLDAFKA